MCVCTSVHTRTHTHTLLNSYCANNYSSHHTFLLNWYFHSHIILPNWTDTQNFLNYNLLQAHATHFHLPLTYVHKPIKCQKSHPTLVHLLLTYFADAPSTVRCIIAMVTRWQRRWYIIHGARTGGFECRRGSETNGVQRSLHHGVLNLRNTHTYVCT